MTELLNILSWICLLLGSFFAVSGGVGILRFPDFFSRLHTCGNDRYTGSRVDFVWLNVTSGIQLNFGKTHHDPRLLVAHESDGDPCLSQIGSPWKPATPDPTIDQAIIMAEFVDFTLLGFLAVVALAMTRLRNLFAVAMLSGINSLLSAGLFVVLDAVDVAFTEAAVGAGITTVLMIGTLALTGSEEKISGRHPVLALLIVVFTGAALIYGTLDMPEFEDPQAPVHQHVAPKYLKDTPAEIGVPNVVTARACQLSWIRHPWRNNCHFHGWIRRHHLVGIRTKKIRRNHMTHNPVLRVIAKLMIPFVLLFALYVQFHGDFGPGGGFQAGVIFGAGLILYGLVFGVETALEVFSPTILRIGMAVGVLLYASVGLAGLALNGKYLNYNVLAHDPLHGQHLGILLVELGVFITVASVMMTIFFAFAGRRA